MIRLWNRFLLKLRVMAMSLNEKREIQQQIDDVIRRVIAAWKIQPPSLKTRDGERILWWQDWAPNDAWKRRWTVVWESLDDPTVLQGEDMIILHKPQDFVVIKGKVEL